MKIFGKVLLLAGIATFSVGVGVAQYRRWADRPFLRGDEGPMVRTEGGEWVNEDTVRTARETAPQVTSTPNWTNLAGFETDVFTFARIIFKSPGRPSVVGW